MRLTLLFADGDPVLEIVPPQAIAPAVSIDLHADGTASAVARDRRGAFLHLTSDGLGHGPCARLPLRQIHDRLRGDPRAAHAAALPAWDAIQAFLATHASLLPPAHRPSAHDRLAHARV